MMNINMEFIENDNKFDMEFEGTQTINGKSAYEIAVENGYVGTEEEWLESLKGNDGHTPVKGKDYYTEADKTEMVQEVLNAMPDSGGAVTAEGIKNALGYVPVNPENMPTKTSQLTNDSGFIKDIPSEYVTETELNAKGYLTQHQDLSNYAKKEDIPTVPAKTSQLTNDSGFITNEQLPTHLPNPNKLTFTGAVTGEYDGSNALNVEIPSGGGSGGNSEWRKVAAVKTEEDLTYISVTEDFDGNPISADELFVTVITTRESSATAVGFVCISPLPSWMKSFLGKGLYFEGLLPDAYLYPVLFKKVGGLVVEQLLGRQVLANNISNVTTWVEDFTNFPGINAKRGNGYTSVNGGVVNGNAIYDSATGLKCFNNEGKLQGVTIGIDNANGIKIGAGTRIEVWAR